MVMLLALNGYVRGMRRAFIITLCLIWFSACEVRGEEIAVWTTKFEIIDETPHCLVIGPKSHKHRYIPMREHIFARVTFLEPDILYWSFGIGTKNGANTSQVLRVDNQLFGTRGNEQFSWRKASEIVKRLKRAKHFSYSFYEARGQYRNDIRGEGKYLVGNFEAATNHCYERLSQFSFTPQ